MGVMRAEVWLERIATRGLGRTAGVSTGRRCTGHLLYLRPCTCLWKLCLICLRVLKMEKLRLREIK